VTAENIANAEINKATVYSISKSTSLESMPALKNKAQEILSGSEWKSLVEDMKTASLKSKEGKFGVDSKGFFSRMSTVMDQFNEALLAEKATVMKQAQEAASHANKIYYFILVGILCAISALVGFTWMIMKDLLAQEAADLIINAAAGRSASMVQNSPVCSMMCDPEGNLIYLNQASIETLRKMETYLPLKVENMIGQSIDIFHTNAADK
jgi:hypothetical protein